MGKVIPFNRRYVNKTETIVQEVKAEIKPELWDKSIKKRIKALREDERVVNEPENTFAKITDEVRSEAESMCEGGIFIAKFIRPSGPTLNKVSICIDSKYLSKTFKKGAPAGVLVAFQKDRKILVGWSSYNQSHEIVPFTKKDAVRIAVLRALTDEVLITKSGNGEYKYLTKSEAHIPRIIGKELLKFVDRARKYYSKEMVENLRMSFSSVMES